jgi:hypothetical protein
LNNIAFRYLMEDQNVVNNTEFLKTYHKYSTDKSKKNEILKIGNAIQLLTDGKSLPEVQLVDSKGTKISSNNLIYALGGSSQDWNSNFTTVCTLSSQWSQGTNIIPVVTNYLSTNNVIFSSVSIVSGSNSFRWTEAYTAVAANSATTWNYQGTDIKALTGNWQASYTALTSTSANWNDTRSVVQTNSAAWAIDNTTDTGVRALTSNWQNSYTALTSTSANWNDARNTVQANSAQWATDNSTDTDVRALTANWQNTYSTVQSNSATTWNYQGTDVKALTSNWQSSYTALTSTSANWNDTRNTVQNNSATTWNPAGVYLPLSGGTISGSARFDSNVTIFGNLSCSGTQTFQNTIFSTTSAVSVVHTGSGPALWVGNNGTGDIASFYDIDANVEILHVGGNNGSFPNVGVKTSTPNVDFTVNGAISASSII